MKLTGPLCRDAIMVHQTYVTQSGRLAVWAGSCAVLVTPHLQEPGQLLG